MLLHLPFKFIGFLELEFSDIPAIIGGLVYGPVTAIIIELIKNLIKALTATTTGGVGELANFLIIAAYVAPLSYLFQRVKGKYRYVISFGTSVIAFVIMGFVVNYFITIPLYAKLYGGMDVIVGISSEMVPAIKDLATIVLFGITPFNIVKGIIISIVGYYTYKFLRNKI
jgi:riboflavin transporter FmnP